MEHGSDRRKALIEAALNAALLFALIGFYLNIDSLIIVTLPSAISPSFFPAVITAALILIAACSCLAGLFRCRKRRRDISPAETKDDASETEAGKTWALFAYIGILLLYVLGLRYAGFVYTTPLVMLLTSLLLGLKHVFIGLATYILFTLLMDYVALHVLQILLPGGLLG